MVRGLSALAYDWIIPITRGPASDAQENYATFLDGKRRQGEALDVLPAHAAGRHGRMAITAVEPMVSTHDVVSSYSQIQTDDGPGVVGICLRLLLCHLGRVCMLSPGPSSPSAALPEHHPFDPRSGLRPRQRAGCRCSRGSERDDALGEGDASQEQRRRVLPGLPPPAPRLPNAPALSPSAAGARPRRRPAVDHAE